MNSPKAKPHATGVPLGGVGAGCVELGPDGRFRNLTLNNNRTSDSRIPVAPHAFCAVRAVRKGKAGVRILQESSDVPFAAAGLDPVFVPASRLQWQGLYPTASYTLDDLSFPVNATWRAVAPIVPYDVDASTLPVVFLLFDVHNPHRRSVEASVLVNWENLSGCTRDVWPEDRGGMASIVEEVSVVKQTPEGRKTSSVDMTAGLEMGRFADFTDNAQGNYAVMALNQDRQTVSIQNWSPSDPESVTAFWQRFVTTGALSGELTADPAAWCGSVCVSFELAPGATESVVFALSWYCPRFVVADEDQSNGYTVRFKRAVDVARHALRFRPYFLKAVDNWQQRLMDSSLPSWLRQMLINSNYVLSTNTLLTRDGRFAMFETPSDPRTGCLDRRFHSSLGILLFFPNLAYNELDQFAKAEPPGQPGRLYRFLGRMNTTSYSLGDDRGELLDLAAKFILMVYRDFHLMGRKADLRKLYPRLKQVFTCMASKDRDGDGLPEQPGFTTTFDQWRFFGVDSYSGSLWLAALRAFAQLERAMDHPHEAEQCEALFAKAQAGFEKRLWNEARGYYYLHDNADTEEGRNEPVPHGCISGQLAGQWYADFLGLGCIVQPERIVRALDVIHAVHETGRTQVSWPAFHLTHYACLDIFHGAPERGLESARNAYELIYGEDGRWVFDQPLSWDLKSRTPCGWGSDRHMSAPSVWHILYALQGFLLNVPDQQLWIRPRLPEGVQTLQSPIFTPVAMGSLKFQETFEHGRYRQALQVSFDSPVRIQTLIVRVPEHVEAVDLRMQGPDGCEGPTHVLGYAGRERLVEIQFAQTVTLTEPLLLALSERR